MIGQDVFNILVGRGVTRLCHANSVSTSISFLKLKGLASRQKVEQEGLPQTNQITDIVDHRFGIWGGIFLDAVDIHARISDRNNYGPVMFQFNIEILNGLPADSEVLVTRSNPTKWEGTVSDAQRYFLNAVDLDAGFEVGNLDQMLVITTENGVIPFMPYLQSIVLDEPRLSEGEGPEFRAAADALLSAAQSNGIQVEVVRRSCAPFRCKCLASYAVKQTRIPWFYKLS